MTPTLMTRLQMTLPRLAALAGAAVLAAACGGGGGDDGGTAVVVPGGARAGAASAGADLSLANAPSVAGVLARAVVGAADGEVPVLASDRAGPLSLRGGVRADTVLARSVREAARRVAGASREAAQAITVSPPQSCGVSGTFVVTVNDADNNLRLSAGDSASFVFSACVFAVGTPAVNGTLGFVVNAVELDAQLEPVALDATVTLTGFAEAGFGSLSGSFRIWYRDETVTTTRQRVSYLGTAVAEPGQALTYNFDAYGVSGTTGGSLELSGALSVGSTAYAMVTPTALAYAAGQLPSSGVVELRDAAGDRVILRPRSSTSFDLEFQAVGAATPTVVQAGLLWASFRLGAN